MKVADRAAALDLSVGELLEIDRQMAEIAKDAGSIAGDVLEILKAHPLTQTDYGSLKLLTAVVFIANEQAASMASKTAETRLGRAVEAVLAGFVSRRLRSALVHWDKLQ